MLLRLISWKCLAKGSRFISNGNINKVCNRKTLSFWQIWRKCLTLQKGTITYCLFFICARTLYCYHPFVRICSVDFHFGFCAKVNLRTKWGTLICFSTKSSVQATLCASYTFSNPNGPVSMGSCLCLINQVLFYSEKCHGYLFLWE